VRLRRHLRRCAVLCATLAGAWSASAQQTDTSRRELPDQVATDIAELYNQAAEVRSDGEVSVAAEHIVEGNVAVLRGPVTIAGVVRGRVLVVNGDVHLRPGGRVEGDVVVVGGFVSGADSTTVGGEVHAFSQSLRYRREGDRIVVESEHPILPEEGWLARWRRRRQMASAKLTLRGGTYDRVEGLPVMGGAQLRLPTSWGRVTADLFGIYRSADNFDWKTENLGYDLSSQVRYGRWSGVAIGGRLFDVVSSVEPWQMRDAEVSLASFFLHRDFRDYFNDRGATGYVSIFPNRSIELRLGYTRTHWDVRDTRDPFTLFRNDAMWRPNPVLDAGVLHLVTAGLTLDTRNVATNPSDGWLLQADVEYGTTSALRLGPTPPVAREGSEETVPVEYARTFIDARRYIRTSPFTQLNLRLLAAGWIGGDRLPLERRFALGGPGTIPGYDFRDTGEGKEALNCHVNDSIPGTPALCERMLMAQMEFRRNISLNLRGHGGQPHWWDFGLPRTVALVAFSDVGRGWLVGDGPGQYSTWSIPSLSTFRVDGGFGIDFNLIGFYVAKTFTDWGESPNFVVRLRQRF